VRAYVALTKPRIIELLLVTTVPAMILAAEGMPPFGLALATLVGGALAAGSANALNCWLDRDIDAVMSRTGRRPSATGEVSPRATMTFGIVLGVVSVALMLLWTNVLAAALTVAAILFYVVGYTLVLKRNTAQNIVWGGAAGCMPTLIGWAAVTGSLAWPPVVLFGIVFFWTPPHYWPLALRFRADYAAAGVPMLPVVAPARTVARHTIAYTVVMILVSLLLWPVAGTTWLYPIAALVLGGVFLAEAIAMRSRIVALPEDADAAEVLRAARPMRVFHWSITYLTLLFLAVAVDALLR
jgi:protoheme IX farnesyltransferase